MGQALSITPPEKFTTERLVLRRPRLPDADDIFNHYARDPEVTRYVTWRPHKHRSEAGLLLQSRLARWEAGEEFSWAITETGKDRVIGAWTQKFLMPGMDKIAAEIQTYKDQIASIEQNKQNAHVRLDELTWLRNTLLSSDGKGLEKAVQYVLMQVGFNPSPGPASLHDLTFEYSGKQFLSEVKGATSSASEEHIRQLNAMKRDTLKKQKRISRAF